MKSDAVVLTELRDQLQGLRDALHLSVIDVRSRALQWRIDELDGQIAALNRAIIRRMTNADS